MDSRREEEIQLTVPGGWRSDRADKVLAALHSRLSRSRWQKLLKEGRVWLDDRVLGQTDRLRSGDTVQITLPAPVPLDLHPVPMDLEILHEDEDLLVLNKAPGRVVHPGAGTGGDTLVHGLLDHCRGALTGIGGAERPGIVHRLDKETSGALVVAKREEAFRSLAEQFAARKVKKYYTALAVGVPDPASGRIENPVGRHPVHRTRMTCRADGREARTDYQVEASYAGVACRVGLRLHTGRTHQIRVHLKEIGHSLLGDRMYGYREGRLGGLAIPVPRVMLHAARIEFIHPARGGFLSVEAPFPEDFREVERLLADLAAG
ncbi:MAG: RluA family pseudouridine synthase [Oceanipulchritudo sp.]